MAFPCPKCGTDCFGGSDCSDRAKDRTFYENLDGLYARSDQKLREPARTRDDWNPMDSVVRALLSDRKDW